MALIDLEKEDALVSQNDRGSSDAKYRSAYEDAAEAAEMALKYEEAK